MPARAYAPMNLPVLRRESPVTLAQEALWRARKRWQQARLPNRLRVACPVRYRSLGYYQLYSEEVAGIRHRATCHYADAICRGEFPTFANDPAVLGFPPPWNLDFVSGSDWPKIRSERISIIRHDGSDVKTPWDLSRLQFLPVLGKAWKATGDDRYRCAAKELTEHWIENNPVGYGVNWVIAMEAALRAISICLLLDLISPQPMADAWGRKLTTSLWEHLVFIEAHNEFSYIARGNHYLSNIVGLFCLASFLQGPGMAKRRRKYCSLIQREMLVQVYKDGGNYEASLGYHLLTLQMFTTAFIVMRRQHMPMRREFWDRLRRMYQLLAGVSDHNGRIPHIGDCDDGRVELLSDDLEQMLVINHEKRHSLGISSQLAIGEALFDESDKQNRRGGHCADQRIFQKMSQAGLATGPASRHTLYGESGIAIASHDVLKVIFLAMPNAIRGKGSHTHNDKLSLLVSLSGKPLFIDPGTGCYTRDIRIRNQFRSTAAHNSIQLDGEEQNRFSTSPAGVFTINNDAKPTPIDIVEADGLIKMSASHDGYRRLGILHKRTVELGAFAVLKIKDMLSGAGHHNFEMRFYLHQSWHIEVTRNAGKEVSCHISDGRSECKLACGAQHDVVMSSHPTRSSSAYGLLTESTVIIVSGTFQDTIEIDTLLVVPGLKGVQA
ncbi:MAG TPA: alginate lyase family protein [Terriglobales bacterium]|nr:alginate lyase family protein [Terriglobales bacterium]